MNTIAIAIISIINIIKIDKNHYFENISLEYYIKASFVSLFCEHKYCIIIKKESIITL